MISIFILVYIKLVSSKIMSGGFVEFNIRQFDMSKVGKNRVICCIGKRHTGKSVLVLDYLYHNQDIPLGSCVSPTDEYNKTFSGKIPDMFIHEEYNADLLEKFVHRQKIITKRRENDPSYKNIDHRAFLIFDDCLSDAKAWINDKNIKFLFYNGRHIGITFILTMQYLLGIPPSLRSNIDFIFICKETKTTNKKKLYEYYAGLFPTYDMFSQVLDECTKDYGCLVIDNTTSSDKLEDQAFWYKADITKLKNFKLCDEMFWSAPAKNEIYDQPEDELAPKPNYQRYSNSRNKSQFNIHRLQKQDDDYSTSNNRSNTNFKKDFNPQRLYS